MDDQERIKDEGGQKPEDFVAPVNGEESEEKKASLIERFKGIFKKAEAVSQQTEHTEEERKQKLNELFTPVVTTLQEMNESGVVINKSMKERYNEEVPLKFEIADWRGSAHVYDRGDLNIWIEDVNNWEESAKKEIGINSDAAIFIKQSFNSPYDHPYEYELGRDRAEYDTRTQYAFNGEDSDAALDKYMEEIAKSGKYSFKE